jgi:hypothetical protein
MSRVLEDNIYGILAMAGAAWVILHMFLILGHKPIPAPVDEDEQDTD